jgi:hypothetical protein
MTTRAFAFIITFATVAKVKSNGMLQHTSHQGSKMHLDRTKVSHKTFHRSNKTHMLLHCPLCTMRTNALLVVASLQKLVGNDQARKQAIVKQVFAPSFIKV